MELIERKKRIIMAQPHQVTESGSIVHFQTDMVAPIEITGSGDVTICGKNFIDDSKRYQQAAGYSLYIGATGTGYNIFLKAGTYRFTADMKNNASYDLYYRKSDGQAVIIWHKEDKVTTATFTLPADGMYRFNFTSATASNVGDCCVSLADDTGYETYNGVTSSTLTGRKSLNGINNVFSNSGNVTVKYWTH